MKEFLPISQEDINARGWEQIDFLFKIGRARIWGGDSYPGN